MKVKLTITSLFWFALSWASVQVCGQDLPATCGGSHVRYGVKGLPSSMFDWEVAGGTILNNYNDSIDVQWELTEGIKTIRVTEYTQANCVGTPEIAHVMVSSPQVEIGGNIEICEGETHTFVPNQLFSSYTWSTGEDSSTIETGAAGTYWLEVADSRGCVGRDSAELIVNNKIAVDLGADTALCPGEKIILDAGFGGIKYVWSTGEISQSIEAGSGNSTIWVDVTSDKGCISRDSVEIRVCNFGNFDIPNAFTPNGDNDNDTWHLSFLQYFSNATVEVFDRWGRMVFQSSEFPTEGWDGKSNGKPLPMDSYYYIIDLHNGADPFTGNVTIIR